VPQTKYKARYKVPASRKSGASPIYWLLALVLAGFLGWLWWASGHPSKHKKQPVARAKTAVHAVAETKVQPVAMPSTSAPSPNDPPLAARAVPPVPITPPPVLPVTNQPEASAANFPRPVQNALEAQIALIGQGISPGSLDGSVGSQTRAALQCFQWQQALPDTGELDTQTKSNLLLEAPPYTAYTVTAEDLARLQPLAPTWLGKSQQTALDFETILELVAEKTFSHPNLIKRLNPSVDWTNLPAGTVLQVPNASYPDNPRKAAWVTIHLNSRTLEAFDSETNVIAHFPCSIAKHAEKRPVGLLHIEVVAPHPNYTFDPNVFPESEEARELHRKLILPPGPNNPVGVAWIGLDRPGYGIHGTPRPEDVGRTESHGCFRLANWNAEFLLRLVGIGTPVYVVE
jgi:lipoprotein-anchoring transpeptidase ErfK/SrfK